MHQLQQSGQLRYDKPNVYRNISHKTYHKTYKTTYHKTYDVSAPLVFKPAGMDVSCRLAFAGTDFYPCPVYAASALPRYKRVNVSASSVLPSNSSSL